MKRGFTTAEVEAFYAANPGGRIGGARGPWYRSMWAVVPACILAGVVILVGLVAAL